MKLYTRLCTGMTKTLVLLTIFVFSSNSAYGATFKDVAATHWAYSSIDAISEQGLMVGDTSGNFRPNDYIDKFDTSRVFARAAGYKSPELSADLSSGLSSSLLSEEKDFIDSAYNKNKNLLASFARSFPKWDSTSDKEVSYLIEKRILIPDDLNQFIIRDSSGNQMLRALSREEASVFLTRLIGEQDAAISGSYNYEFGDDAKISITCKPYVYFLKNKGIISGEADGNFNPKGAVTRAALAVMLSKAFEYENSVGQSTSDTSANDEVPVSKVETVSGKIEKLYPTLSALQILTSDGNSKIYKINGTAEITIDNYTKEYKDLTEGMILVAILVDGTIADIKAQNDLSVDVGLPAQTTATDASSAQGESALSEDALGEFTSAGSASSGFAPVESAPVEFALEGIVTKASEESGREKLDIEVRILSPRGEVISTAYSFNTAENCVITRGDNTVEFDAVHVGDIAKLKILDGWISLIDLEEKDISISDGVLLAKKYDEQTKTAILSVQSPAGRIYDFQTTDSTYLSRNGNGGTSWNYLRVGDKVELAAEYDKLMRLFATGEYSSVNGVITEVNISKTGSYLVVTDDQGKSSKYGFISSVIDFNSLKIGNRVWLRLDSLEIESFSVIESGATSTAVGYVAAIRSNTIVIADSLTGSNSMTQEIVFDSDTAFTDGRTGANATVANVHQGMRLSVTLANANSNLAKTIMILE